MEHFRGAERALVAALALGDADRDDVRGRLRGSDFTDPAAATLFQVVMNAERPVQAAELSSVLQRQGLLRRDGYPLSELLDWLPHLPVPVHPQAWATLVVAGTLGRQVHACGERLLQAAEAGRDGAWTPGEVLALGEAQGAAVMSAVNRWGDLPAHWRDTAPARSRPEPAADGGVRDGVGLAATLKPAEVERRAARERVLLAGLVAAPQLLGRIPWLDEADFTDRACGSVYATVRRAHERGGLVDGVTLPSLCDDGPAGWAGEAPLDVARALRPEVPLPTTVPLLSRMVLADALLDRVERTGRELVAIAAAPACVDGLGGGMLTAAQDRLTALRPWSARWEQALKSSRAADRFRSGLERSGLERSGAERSSVVERPAGAERSWRRGSWSGVDRDAG